MNPLRSSSSAAACPAVMNLTAPKMHSRAAFAHGHSMTRRSASTWVESGSGAQAGWLHMQKSAPLVGVGGEPGGLAYGVGEAQAPAGSVAGGGVDHRVGRVDLAAVDLDHPPVPAGRVGRRRRFGRVGFVGGGEPGGHPEEQPAPLVSAGPRDGCAGVADGSGGFRGGAA